MDNGKFLCYCHSEGAKRLKNLIDPSGTLYPLDDVITEHNHFQFSIFNLPFDKIFTYTPSCHKF